MVEYSLGSLGTPIFPCRIRAVLSIPKFPKSTTFSPTENMVYVRKLEKNLHHENSLQTSEVHDLQCRDLEWTHALRGKALTGKFYLTPIIASIRVICLLKNRILTKNFTSCLFLFSRSFLLLSFSFRPPHSSSFAAMALRIPLIRLSAAVSQPARRYASTAAASRSNLPNAMKEAIHVSNVQLYFNILY